MTRFLVVSMVGLMTFSCASREIIPVSDAVPVPMGWHAYSKETLGRSQCPRIAGKYLEPPERYSTPGSQFAKVDYLRFGYIAVLPFNLSERKVLSQSDVELNASEFEFVQKNGESFLLHDIGLGLEIFEHLFLHEQGDFECKEGMMYFPLETIYGADQQGSYNAQHQGILATDSNGNLILIRISGPYKNTLLNRKANFEYDYMRYKKID